MSAAIFNTTRGERPNRKRRIAKRLTEALSEETQVDPRYVSLSLLEVEAEGFAEAGELVLDRRTREQES